MKEQLKKLFPFISAAASLGGPAGTVVASLVGKALGIDKLDSADIESAIAKATPEQLIQLKQVDADAKFKLQELGFNHVEEMERIGASERDSARNREIQVKDWMPKALGLGALGLFATCLILLTFYELPQTAKETVLVLLGVLGGMVKDVYGYYFGSSVGSHSKDDALAQIAKS